MTSHVKLGPNNPHVKAQGAINKGHSLMSKTTLVHPAFSKLCSPKMEKDFGKQFLKR